MTEPTSEQGGFYPATHWTQIYQARDLDKTYGRSALGELLTRYRGALLQHLTWKFQSSPEQAEDWLQSFVEKKVLEYRLMDRADKDKGRFRSFLLSALDRFVWDEIARGKAQKRQPKEGLVALEEAADTPMPTASSATCDPGDVEWARSVLQRAVRQTREWYHAKRETPTWDAFYLGRIQPMLDGSQRPSDQAIGEASGLPIEKVSNTINNAARKFRTELRGIVKEYATDEAEVEEEFHSLIEILKKAG